MVPNTTSKVQMFSQVTQTSAICKHAIHRETVGDLDDFARFRDALLVVDFDFRQDAFNSYNEFKPSSSKPPSNTSMVSVLIPSKMPPEQPCGGREYQSNSIPPESRFNRD